MAVRGSVLIVTGTLLLVPVLVRAQGGTRGAAPTTNPATTPAGAPAPAPAPEAQTPPKPAEAVVPRVVGVVNVTKADRDKARPSADVTASKANAPASPQVGVTAELRDVLLIKVRDVNAWREKNADALHLFVAGIELSNVVAVPAAADPTDAPAVGAVRVTLEPGGEKDAAVRKAWVQVLQAAMNRDDKEQAADKRLPLSVGPAGKASFASDVSVELVVFPWYTAFVVVFLIALVVIILVLGKRSNLLRDANGAVNPPYSLAKHQMAAWFVVVIGAYLYIWLITGFFASISTTALTLIGISGATGLVAVTMDAAKRSDAAAGRAALEAERAALDQTLNDAKTGLQAQLQAAATGTAAALEIAAAIAPKLARLEELKAQLAVPVVPPESNRRWYLDLLSDEKGISFHRLQIAIWTLVLVIVFVKAVYQDILMPDFDTTLLGLMGISSGTYLGFKLPEKPS